MFVRNTWYVAAWASEVGPDTLMARTLLGVPVVLWRDSDGRPLAFEDRCCHRGAPLSVGRREGNCLRCMYHGMKFDADGICVEIPAQDRIPATARVKTFRVVEQGTFLWIWMGDEAKCDPALIPQTPWMESPEWAHLEGYTYYDTSYLLISDNLLDLAHLPFVHATTLGGDESYADTPAKIEALDNGVRVTRWVRAINPPPFVQKVKAYEGKIDRWNNYDFMIPGIFLMDSGVAPTGTGAPEGNRVDAAEFRSTQALTPETEHSTHYFYSQPHNFAVDKPEVTKSIHQSVVDAFEEDRAMIRAQSRSLDLEPGFKMVPLAADQALGRFRWLVNKLVTAEQAAAGATPAAPIGAKPAAAAPAASAPAKSPSLASA